MTATYYEITAYAVNGEQVNLNGDPKKREDLRANNVWDAVSIMSRIPANGWLYWDDAAPEYTLISCIVLRHIEVIPASRNRREIQQVSNLETIERFPTSTRKSERD